MTRVKNLLLAAAAVACTALGMPQQAEAFGYREHRPDGWDNARVVRHWVYYPRYVHVYNVDPYAYQHSPRGYYPYYGSRYWVPAHVVRKRNYYHYNNWNVQPPRYRYHPAWGYPKRWHHGKAWRAKRGYRYHRWHY